MNYHRHKAEDLVMDESFQQYCAGTNPAAVRFWTQWQEENPEKQELVRVAKVLYLRLNGGLDGEVFAVHHRRFVEALRANGIEPGVQLPVRKEAPVYHWKRYGIAVAAVLAGLVAASVWLQRSPKGAAVAEIRDSRPVYNSKPGERKSFQLPDGTKVVLNAGSTLWLDDGFNNGKRTLTLEGEAFFDVAQNVQAPFIIRTEQMNITVLGTAFNVKAYKDDETAEASLVRGRIKVALREGQQVYLRPDEKVVVNREDIKKHDLRTVPAIEDQDRKTNRYYSIDSLTHIPQDSAIVELSWLDNRLIFADASFGEIARKLERWYGVSIRFESDELRGYHFTGHFNKENLVRVLEVLQLSRRFTFRFENETTVVLQQ